MMTSDQFLYTAARARSSRKPPAFKVESQSRQKPDVKKTFDALASKLGYKRRSLKETELASSISSISLYTGELQTKPELALDTEGSYQHDDESHQMFRFGEPTTPDELTSDENCCFDTPESVATSVPALSPDNTFGGVLSNHPENHQLEPLKPRKLPHREPLRRYISQESLRSNAQNNANSSSAQAYPELESCGLCDMPLLSAFKLETPVRMKCGHRAHKQCREDLILVSEEFGDEMPTCTICSGSIAIISAGRGDDDGGDPSISDSNRCESRRFSSENLFGGIDATKKGTAGPVPSSPDRVGIKENLGSRHNQHQSLADIMSPERQTIIKRPSRKSLSTSTSNTPSAFTDPDPAELSPASNSSSRSRALSISSEVSAVSKRSLRLNSGETGLMRSLLSKAVSNQNTSSGHDLASPHPLKMFTYVSPCEKDSSDSGTIRVGMWLHCPEPTSTLNSLPTLHFPEYRTSAKDVTYGIGLKKELEKLKYDSKPLSSAQLGILRLHSQVRVTSPVRDQLDWPQVDCYLFENHIVLVTASDSRVRAVLNAAQAIASAEAGIHEPSILCLRFTIHNLPELHLHTESPAIVALWTRALKNRWVQFPLHPRLYLSYLEEVEVALELNQEKESSDKEKRAPVKAVICIPSSVASSGLQAQQLLNDSLMTLGGEDRVAIIAYHKGNVFKDSGLREPSWSGWVTVLGERDPSRSQPGGHADPESSLRGSKLSSASTTTSSVTFDNVLKAAENLLSGSGARDGSSVTVVSEDDTKLGSIPTLFADSAIPIHTIGLGDGHDALTLSTISRTTGGTYVSAKKPSEARAVLSGIMKRETKLILKNITLRFKARMGAEIMSLQQASLKGGLGLGSAESGDRMVEWKVGPMRRGEWHSLTFDVKGSIAEGKPLLQVIVEHESALHAGGCVETSFVRLNAPSINNIGMPDDKDLRNMLKVECALSSAFQVLQDALALILSEDYRRAFGLLSQGLDRLIRSSEEIVNADETASEARGLIEILAAYFDQQCDNIIEHKLPVSSLVREYLQKLWLFESRHSLLVRDRLEAAFY